MLQQSWANAWGIRLLVLVCTTLLCWLAGSAIPALAFFLTWFPNYPFLGATMLGILRLPRFLEPVHPVEPVLYRWAGVGIIKWAVTSRAWSLLVGTDPTEKAASREALLARVEVLTKGAEVVHGATLVFASTIAVFCLAVGWDSLATWIVPFNVALNWYPILLQRSNRWRLQQVCVDKKIGNDRGMTA